MGATQRQKDSMKKRAKSLKDQGVCVRCGKGSTLTKNGVLCYNCMQKHIKFRIDQRRRVLRHYGGKCACCSESNLKFLTIDHLLGGGMQHRKQIKGQHIEAWLEKNEYPEGYQVLCYNCNCGQQYNVDNPGICPHKEG